MKKLLLPPILLLSLHGCAATWQAGARRQAEWRYSSCLKTAMGPSNVLLCREQSEDYCDDLGLEKSCGTDLYWTGR